MIPHTIALPDASAADTTGDALRAGERGIVCGFDHAAYAHKYMCMGVLPGSEVEMIRATPFGKTCYLKIDGRALAVRKQEAACLLLKRLAGPAAR